MDKFPAMEKAMMMITNGKTMDVINATMLDEKNATAGFAMAADSVLPLAAINVNING